VGTTKRKKKKKKKRKKKFSYNPAAPYVNLGPALIIATSPISISDTPRSKAVWSREHFYYYYYRYDG
jgi:hypothetical protein